MWMITNHWIKQIIDNEVKLYLESIVGRNYDAKFQNTGQIAQLLKDISSGSELKHISNSLATHVPMISICSYPDSVQNILPRYEQNNGLFSYYSIKWTVRSSRDMNGFVMTYLINKVEVSRIDWFNRWATPQSTGITVGVDVNFI